MELLNKQEHEISRSLFVSHDSDDSGELSTSELAVLLDGLGYKPGIDMIRSLLLEFDKDQNGTFDYEEFMQLLKAYRQIEKKEVRKRCGFMQEEVVHFPSSSV